MFHVRCDRVREEMLVLFCGTDIPICFSAHVQALLDLAMNKGNLHQKLTW